MNTLTLIIVFIAGFVCAILLSLYILLRPKTAARLGVKKFLIGSDLHKSLEQLYSELPNQITRKTLGAVTANVFLRLTRIGVFGLAITLIPIFLLVQQNDLISSQNELFSYQNDRVKEQTDLLKTQNDRLAEQNTLFQSQNTLFQSQNYKLDNQIILSEAQRRSSLNFLLGSLLDQINDELKTAERKGAKRRLSLETIGRISSLSQSFQPYRYIKGDTLITTPLSPERAQLLLAIVHSNLDTATLDSIYKKTTFAHADLGGVNLKQGYLKGVNLQNAFLMFSDLSNTNLRQSDLVGATLMNVNLRNADLKEANLTLTDLRYTALREGDLKQTILVSTRLNHITNLEFIKNLEGAIVNCGWLQMLEDLRVEGWKEIQGQYSLEEIKGGPYNAHCQLILKDESTKPNHVRDTQ